MPEDRKAPEQIIRGIVGHDALAEYYIAKKAGKSKYQCIDIATEVLTDAVSKYPNLARMLMHLIDVITAYADRYWDEKWDIVETERARIVDFNGHTFGFRLDLLAELSMRGKKRLVLIDHKFVASHWQPMTLSLAPQLPKYLRALQLDGVPVEDAILNQINYRGVKGGGVAPADTTFRRSALKNPPQSLMDITVEQHCATASKIEELHKLSPSEHKKQAPMHRDKYTCDGCWFDKLCHAELYGKSEQEVLDIADITYKSNTYGYDEDDVAAENEAS